MVKYGLTLTYISYIRNR